MKKDLLLAVTATAVSGVRTEHLTFSEAWRVVNLEHNAASRHACVQYLQKSDVITSATAAQLNAEISQQEEGKK